MDSEDATSNKEIGRLLTSLEDAVFLRGLAEKCSQEWRAEAEELREALQCLLGMTGEGMKYSERVAKAKNALAKNTVDHSTPRNRG